MQLMLQDLEAALSDPIRIDVSHRFAQLYPDLSDLGLETELLANSFCQGIFEDGWRNYVHTRSKKWATFGPSEVRIIAIFLNSDLDKIVQTLGLAYFGTSALRYLTLKKQSEDQLCLTSSEISEVYKIINGHAASFSTEKIDRAAIIEIGKASLFFWVMTQPRDVRDSLALIFDWQSYGANVSSLEVDKAICERVFALIFASHSCFQAADPVSERAL